MNKDKIKILIIRFSSIGDIIQCLYVVGLIKENFPEVEIHWVTRKDMADILLIDTRIDKVWIYERETGFLGLVKLFHRLKQEKFTYIYDAHNNIRSSIIKFLFFFFNPYLLLNKRVITRSKERIKRFFLFTLRINYFPQPFIGVYSYVKPLLHLKKFKLTENNNRNIVDFISFPADIEKRVDSILAKLNGQRWICIVPSAAWELKRWPVDYWIELIKLLPNLHFVILGGPQDSFCETIASADKKRVINLSGKTKLIESLFIVYKAEIIISGDTGFLHAADFFGKKGIALIGPTAFGYPFNKSIKILEKTMKCKPCSKDGRGKCKNKEYKKCMKEIYPEEVKKTIEEIL